jgi:hypothetical protein
MIFRKKYIRGYKLIIEKVLQRVRRFENANRERGIGLERLKLIFLCETRG